MENTNKIDLFIKISTIFIIFVAIAIRITAFCANYYDITIDECHSVLWCRDDLKKTLTYFSQGANFLPGYKLMLKGIYSVFKFNFIAFKFSSLIAGILAIFAFKSLSFKIFQNKVLFLLSLIFFAFNYSVIFYSCMAKPYEFDILFSLFIINLFITIDETGINEFLKRKTKYLYGISVSIILYCSIPSIVIFFLSSFVLLIRQLIKKDKQAFIKLIKIISCFLILLGIEYFTYINQMIGDSGLKDMWLSDKFYFMPNSLDAVKAIINFSFIQFNWWDSLEPHINNYLIISLLIMFFTGTYLFLRKDNFRNGIYICLPVYFFILLSFLEIYPFSNRCITFLIPIFIFILLKSFDININKPLKVIFTTIALFICGYYLYFVTVEYFSVTDYLKKDTARINMIKKHLLEYENLKDDEILFSVGHPCFRCFNNSNVYTYVLRTIKDDEIDLWLIPAIENKNKIFINYDYYEINNTKEELNKYIKYFESKNYKLVKKDDTLEELSYLELKKYDK